MASPNWLSAPGQGQSPAANPVIHRLSVSEIETLAKAGVQVKWEDIKDQVRPNPTGPRLYSDPRLTQAIVDRWSLAHPANDGDNVRIPFDLAATKYGDKVYVFASFIGGWGNLMSSQGRSATEPCIITDDVPLFPSDALMTKLIFMKENAK